MNFNLDFFSQSSQQVAVDILGALLCVRQGETVSKAMIVETEAYGPGDPAMHAYRQKTARNEPMFSKGGTSYVYLIYGIHHCFNIVTDRENVPSAILIRAVDFNYNHALEQTKKEQRKGAGPGKLCKVLGLTRSHTNLNILCKSSPIWVEPYRVFHETDIVTTTRIGITKGVKLPWRWYLRASPAVSVY